ncbi:MAG: histidinol-phosphatase [Porticoccaceae bacterium]|nr:histidinol-phosphatase [Porticoccaceae bacterium]
MLSQDEKNELYSVAMELADAARVAILPLFRATSLPTDNKLEVGYDPVTEADRNAEKVMREILAARRPQDAIVGEEYAVTAGTSGLTWVLDPIDGTRGFVSGTPTWGVLIAVSDDCGPLFGVIDQPFIGERFIGGFNKGRYDGPHSSCALATRATEKLSAATLFTTFPEVGTEHDRAGFQAVADQVQLVRYGMDCYAYALLALGQIDLVVEAGLNMYDIHAPIAVIHAAGGIFTDWDGQPAHHGGQVVAAANPACHRAALELLQPFAEPSRTRSS